MRCASGKTGPKQKRLVGTEEHRAWIPSLVDSLGQFCFERSPFSLWSSNSLGLGRDLRGPSCATRHLTVKDSCLSLFAGFSVHQSALGAGTHRERPLPGQPRGHRARRDVRARLESAHSAGVGRASRVPGSRRLGHRLGRADRGGATGGESPEGTG